MDHRQVGRSGLRVSRLGLGTLTWGRDTDEHDAADLLRVFREAGGTVLETTPAETSDAPGAAEATVGRLLATGADREDLVLVSRSGPRPQGAVRSRRGLLGALDASLQRLGVDELDLWLLDGWSDSVPLEEALSALEAAVTSGRVSYAGLSGVRTWQLAHAVTVQDLLRRSPFVALGTEWSLLDRRVEAELLPACSGLGLGVVAGAPLGRGVLTGKYRNGIPSDSRAASSHLSAGVEPALGGRGRSVVDAVATAAEGLGVSPLAVSLGWLLARPALSCALVGARTPGQLRAVLAAESAAPLPEAILGALDDVSAT